MNQVSTSSPKCMTKTPCCILKRAKFEPGARPAGWCGSDFKTLCGGPRSQNDYLEIATQFHTVLLSDVPYMPGEHGIASAAVYLAGGRKQ